MEKKEETALAPEPPEHMGTWGLGPSKFWQISKSTLIQGGVWGGGGGGYPQHRLDPTKIYDIPAALLAWCFAIVSLSAAVSHPLRSC